MIFARRSVRKSRRHVGFTLLEIILALSILAGGLAIVSESVRIAQQNARVARDLTDAQMLCEAKMNELASGVTPLDAASGVPFGAPYAGWDYSVETGDTDVSGLHAVTVTVYQDPAPKIWPVQYSLVRWVGDSSTTAASSDSSNGSPSSASSSTPNSNSSNSSNGSQSGNSSSSGSAGGTGT